MFVSFLGEGGLTKSEKKVLFIGFLSKLLELKQQSCYTKTYWPAGGGRGQNPENTAQGHSGQNAIRP